MASTRPCSSFRHLFPASCSSSARSSPHILKPTSQISVLQEFTPCLTTSKAVRIDTSPSTRARSLKCHTYLVVSSAVHRGRLLPPDHGSVSGQAVPRMVLAARVVPNLCLCHHSSRIYVPQWPVEIHDFRRLLDQPDQRSGDEDPVLCARLA
ncbi:hypothetical protein FKP32DRAFT_1441120 [Trametes sanguinea]|nr:hypothetical protein FKP32DRAFT_1441120 [Trametes sanguinea]